jgi:hypothetical protein
MTALAKQNNGAHVMRALPAHSMISPLKKGWQTCRPWENKQAVLGLHTSSKRRAEDCRFPDFFINVRQPHYSQ